MSGAMLDKVSLMLQNFFLQAEKAESCNSRLQYNFRNSFPLYHSFINEIQPNLTKRGKFLKSLWKVLSRLEAGNV